MPFISVEEIDDLPGSAGFAQAREDPRDAIGVSVRVQVGHGVDCERDMEAVLVRVARG